MRLSDLLSDDRVDTALAATSKDAALDAIAALLVRGVDNVDVATIRKVLREREALASTGVGDEVAIPHGRLPGLARLVAALAIAPDGVEFESIDQRPVRIFVAILAPDANAGDHIRALVRVGKLLRDRRVREKIMNAQSSSAILQAIRDEEGPAP